MLAVILSWIIISIVFLSVGDLFISLYNKLCKRHEEYGLTDIFVVGMCVALIPVSLLSLWLPTNEYTLLAFVLFGLLYGIVKRNRLRLLWDSIREKKEHYGILQWLVFLIPIVSLILVIVWQVGVFDSLYYHQQNIRWNEEYSAVPGLANLEHRYGFNSNYLLLSALFSFRFLFSEAVYSLHVLVLVYVLCWIIKEIIQSGYEIRRVALLLIMTAYIFTFGYTFTATSTDAIPNVVAFYLIAKLLLYPERLKKDILFLIFVPVAMVTFKLSMLPLCLLSLYPLYLLLKGKDYKQLSFILPSSIIVIALWLIRNVIITGYLIFPLHQIDLFSVDWKVPEDVLIAERDFIYWCGVRSFNDMLEWLINWQFCLSGLKEWLLCFLYIGGIAISPFLTIYAFVKKRYLSRNIFFIYLTLLALLGLWYTGGPDPRFMGGILFVVIFYDIFLLLSLKEEKRCPKTGILVLTVFSLIMLYWPVTRTLRFTQMFSLSNDRQDARPMWNTLIRQYPYKELLKSQHTYVDAFYPYQLGRLTIYISESPELPYGRFVCFDEPFPCTVEKTPISMKYLGLDEIEARGESLQDGFKAK
ncbi:hypothetical protein [Dysgonomonas sp. 511]|uniref:LIC_10190 family membrane protein n=1 Tax=Dysgonomonas sp. 511 TaxID=2302930 RepID=UPI0013D8733A|nr:hypothetical protein [Dysgonomonas sp. 511]NDV77614.1 hypothetical protein [Dysgonomonas sp. 511]